MALRKTATYGQPNVTPVHNHHDEASNASEAAEVTCNHQGDCDNMMGHHLHMVFSPFFSVDDQNLMEVEGSLCKVVEFYWTGEVNVGVAHP